AFAEVEDFVTRGGTFAGDGVHLVIAVEMVLVSPVAEFNSFKQLVGDVRVAGGSHESRKPIQARENAVLHRIRRHMAGPTKDARNAETALEDCPLALRERRGATIGPGK